MYVEQHHIAIVLKITSRYLDIPGAGARGICTRFVRAFRPVRKRKTPSRTGGGFTSLLRIALQLPERGLAFHPSPSWLGITGRLARFRRLPWRLILPLVGARSFQVLSQVPTTKKGDRHEADHLF